MTEKGFKCIFFLLIIVVIATITTTITLSSYTTNTTGTGTINIATCEVDIAPINFVPTNLNKPGDEQILTFNIVNYTGQKVSEINQNYSIKVTTSNNLPFTYELQCTNTGTNGTGINTTKQTITPNIAVIGGMLPFSAATTHTYALTVTWPSNQKDISLIDEIDLITVTVNAEQII